jgi:hypothetical protein
VSEGESAEKRLPNLLGAKGVIRAMFVHPTLWGIATMADYDPLFIDVEGVDESAVFNRWFSMDTFAVSVLPHSVVLALQMLGKSLTETQPGVRLLCERTSLGLSHIKPRVRAPTGR